MSSDKMLNGDLSNGESSLASGSNIASFITSFCNELSEEFDFTLEEVESEQSESSSKENFETREIINFGASTSRETGSMNQNYDSPLSFANENLKNAINKEEVLPTTSGYSDDFYHFISLESFNTFVNTCEQITLPTFNNGCYFSYPVYGSSGSSVLGGPPQRPSHKIKGKKHCVNCLSEDGFPWRKNSQKETLCNPCGLHLKKCGENRPSSKWNKPIQRRNRKAKEKSVSK
ncbi:UNVERIFIED_CONTAM: hypothetical protein RMT77_016957 [Armadillidium vulgare]